MAFVDIPGFIMSCQDFSFLFLNFIFNFFYFYFFYPIVSLCMCVSRFLFSVDFLGVGGKGGTPECAKEYVYVCFFCISGMFLFLMFVSYFINEFIAVLSFTLLLSLRCLLVFFFQEDTE